MNSEIGSNFEAFEVTNNPERFDRKLAKIIRGRLACLILTASVNFLPVDAESRVENQDEIRPGGSNPLKVTTKTQAPLK